MLPAKVRILTIFIWDVDQLRTEVNRTLEAARTGKLIGSSLEAKVYLHAFDESLAVRLNDMCETKNDADTLHRIFITSQVCLEITQICAPVIYALSFL